MRNKQTNQRSVIRNINKVHFLLLYSKFKGQIERRQRGQLRYQKGPLSQAFVFSFFFLSPGWRADVKTSVCSHQGTSVGRESKQPKIIGYEY